MGFTGYILRSDKNGKYYVGQTEDLESRLKEHNNGEEKSTKPWRPWKLMYEKLFATRSEAVQWERMVKGRKSRAFKEQLIQEYQSERSAVPSRSSGTGRGSSSRTLFRTGPGSDGIHGLHIAK